MVEHFLKIFWSFNVFFGKSPFMSFSHFSIRLSVSYGHAGVLHVFQKLVLCQLQMLEQAHVVSNLQMRKLMHRNVKQLLQGHTASKLQSQDLNSGSTITLSTITSYCMRQCPSCLRDIQRVGFNWHLENRTRAEKKRVNNMDFRVNIVDFLRPWER